MTPAHHTRTGPIAIGLVLLVVLLLGVPAVWQSIRDRDVSLETIFFPVLGVAFGFLAFSRLRREK